MNTEHVRVIEFFQEISRRLTITIGIEDFMGFVLPASIELFHGTACSLYLAQPPTGSSAVALKYQAGKMEGVEEKRRSAIAKHSLLIGKPSNEVWKVDPNPAISHAIQVIAIPITIDNVLSGAFVFEKPGNGFAQYEVEYLTLTATFISIALHNHQMLQSEREQREYAEALRDSAEALSSTLSLDKLLDRILQDLGAVVHHDAAHIMLIEAGIAQVMRCVGYTERGFEDLLLSRKFTISEIPHLRLLTETKKPLAVSNIYGSTEWSNLPEANWIRSYAGAPIISKGDIVGFLGVDSGMPGFFSEDDAFRLQAFANQTATALENARLHARIQHQAMIDELSGLLNRRGLIQSGEKEIARCLRHGRPLSAILLDIDNFKGVNDQYGHPTGDRVIRLIADCVKARIRKSDIAARIGGDEMIILLPETTEAQAKILAEGIQADIPDFSPGNAQSSFKITLSLGVYEINVNDKDIYSILAKTDQALYQAKRDGKNRVSIKRE
jgi:diguanylate cyclase (GGDEF)-like protein